MADLIQRQRDISALLQQQNYTEAVGVLQPLNYADQARLIQQFPIEYQIELLSGLAHQGLVFEFFPFESQRQLISRYPLRLQIELFDDMHSDDATDLYKSLTDAEQDRIYQQLDQDTQEHLKALSAYAEESAGAIMSSDYVSMPADFTMQQAIEALRHEPHDRETLYLIYVTNDQSQLKGVISLRQILQADRDARIQEVMTKDVVTGWIDEDQESIARKLAEYDFMALPIVDHAKRLMGIVTYDDAMDVVQAETTEDFLKASAVSTEPGMSIKKAPILKLYQKRVFWLVILVFGSLLSGLGISYYEDIIAAHIVLVFFLPLLVGSGGNAGSQSATLMVRALATGDVKIRDWFYLLGRETLVALCLGGTMAIAVSILGYYRGDATVALVLALSMMGIVLLGCLIGMSLPFILNKLKLDPASASAPLVTSICDATGVVVYLMIASQLLNL
ncbi:MULTISPECIES: magnesium transporter [unclassified Acinetobacter]|uniref:magnesium transporter n=1 Tax=unclassified Acinetobacter TaxID=196816 RepID=UPI0015D20774|nr:MULTISPECIES: magnesium transporter [unclassified Acinetobacter]QOW49105.1 magnesium transporter [Acinetobacter sp. YH12138]